MIKLLLVLGGLAIAQAAVVTEHPEVPVPHDVQNMHSFMVIHDMCKERCFVEHDRDFHCFFKCIDEHVHHMHHTGSHEHHEHPHPMVVNHERRLIPVRNLYNEGVRIRNQLVAIRRRMNMPGGLNDLLNFLPTVFNNNNVNTPFTSIFSPGFVNPPKYGFLGVALQSLKTFLEQVIQTQQEVLQVIVGCNCNSTMTTTTPMTTVPVTMMTTDVPVTVPPMGP